MERTPRSDLPYTDADVERASEELRRICFALPEVSERASHGAITFFVRGKRTLCYLTDDHHGDARLAVIAAAPAGSQEELLETDPERFFRPPYVGHRGWIGLRVDIAPDWDEVGRVVRESYRCVAPVTLVRKMDTADGGA